MSGRAVSRGFDPTDYDIPDPCPEWDPPRWLTDFVRDEVRPFLDRHQPAALDALQHWLAERSQTDGWLQQCATALAEGGSLDEALKRPPTGNEALDLPLPLQHTRNYSLDVSLVVLLAVHDATRRPRDRLRSTERGLYGVLCGLVQKMVLEDLPDLRSILANAAAALCHPSPQRNASIGSGLAPPAAPMSVVEARASETPTLRITATMDKILRTCRRQHLKGETLAMRVGLEYNYARKLFSQLVKAGKLRNDPTKGYRTV
jgi:hypothetical protein